MIRHWILELLHKLATGYMSECGFMLYGGGKGDSPDTPDYAALAKEQGVANLAAARATAKLNNPNIINPYGTQTVTYGSGPPTFDQAGYDAAMADYQKALAAGPNAPSNPWLPAGWRAGVVNGAAPKAPDKNSFYRSSGDPDIGTVTQTLSPAEKEIYDKNVQQRSNIGDVGITGSESLKDIIGKQMDFSGAPAVGDGSATRSKVYDALMGRVNEDTANQRDQRNSELIAAGIRPGTKAYDDAQNLISRQFNDARGNAEVQAGNAAQQQFGMDTQNRQQYISELLAQRQTPLNEINALLSGTQVNNPFAGNLGYQAGANVQPAPIFAAGQAQGQADINAFNAKQAGGNSMMGGLFSLGAAGIGAYPFQEILMALPIYDNIPELGAEANAIARRRKIAEAMLAQSQEQIPSNQMAGQVVAPVSWTQGLAKLANAYLGRKTSEDADKAERGLADKRQQMVADALANINKTAQGSAGVDGIETQPERTIQAPAPMQEGQVAPNYNTVPETVPAVAGRAAVPAVAPNKRQAIMDAVMSNLPEVQKYGGAMLSFDEADRKTEDAKVARKEKFENDRALALEKIDEQFKNKMISQEQSESFKMAVANMRDDTSRDLARFLAANKGSGGGGSAYSVPVQTKDGIYAFDTRTKTMTKMSNADGSPIIGSASDVSLKKEIQSASEEGKLLGKDKGNIASKEDAMFSLQNAKKLLDEGIYTGGYADVQSGADKYNPMADKKKLERTQAFTAEIGNVVIPRLQEFGGNDSNEELRYLKGIMGGDITVGKGALEKVLKSSEEKIQRGIDRAKSANSGAGNVMKFDAQGNPL